VDVLAAIRPDDWNLPLVFHVLGAMIATGGLLLAGTYLWGAWRSSSAETLRLGYQSLLWIALPGFVVMRVFAQVIYDKENLDAAAEDPAWIGIGFGISDLGGLLLIASTALAGLAARRARLAEGRNETSGSTQVRVAAGLITFLLALYVVALWAMTTKPA
jgi:hypothetical protein